MFMKNLLLLLLCSAPLAGFAEDIDNDSEDEYEPPLAYAYQNTLEIFGGWSCVFGHYGNLMDKGLGCFGKGVTDGANFQMRFTRFFSKEWGGYVQFGFYPIYGNSMQLCERMAKESGWQGEDWERFDDFVCWEREGGGSVYGSAIVGVTYRYDFGNRWSLRPRLGIGYRSMNEYCDNEVICRKYSSNEREFIAYDFDICDKNGHSIDNRINRVRRPAINGSLQIQFTPRRHMFFSAEIGLTSTIGHLYQRTSSHRWIAQTDEWGNPRETIEIFPTQTSVHRVGQMGNFLDISFGIGWNIGWNRNDKSRTR